MNDFGNRAEVHCAGAAGLPQGQTLRRTSAGKLIGRHPSILEAVQTVERVASSDCTVLVTGETGTGKELVVAALHDASRRARGPLIPVNCGAMPENLIEDQLFGHAKGAFTGAWSDTRGLVAAAEGGTLFLDEIGDLPLPMQVKILRLIQKHEYTPVGSNGVRRCDFRVVAATHKNLEDEVRAGRFREDLYFRLNVVQVHLPALRQRAADIEALANHFLQKFSAEVGRPALAGFSEDALDAMRRYAWPGNVRFLENVVQRAVLLSPGPRITLRDLPAQLRGATEADTDEGSPLAPRVSVAAPRPYAVAPVAVDSPAPPAPVPSTRGPAPEVELPAMGLKLRDVIEAYENSLIRQAMARVGSNKNSAAKLLGLNRTTLVEMIKRKKLFTLDADDSHDDVAPKRTPNGV
jgi:sigma-54 specific flagellar transcriptional regulator A